MWREAERERDIEGGVHCREGREKGKEGKGGGWYFTTCLMSKRTCKILQLTVECCPEQGGPYTITQQSEGVLNSGIQNGRKLNHVYINV